MFSALNPKLKKLTFLAFSSVERTGLPVGRFVAQYNPESFSQTYGLEFQRNKRALNTGYTKAEYAFNNPSRLSLKLVLDGTGIDETGLLPSLGTQTVSQRVKQFVDLTYRYQGNIHEPNYLRVEWGGQDNGGLQFDCRLESVTILYTSFDRDGSPLRAELDITLVHDVDPKKRVRLEYKRSPDMTHTVVVQAGDTLPLLTQRIYGTTDAFLQVAEFNQLDHFRELVPGQTLHFPPLARS